MPSSVQIHHLDLGSRSLLALFRDRWVRLITLKLFMTSLRIARVKIVQRKEPASLLAAYLANCHMINLSIRPTYPAIPIQSRNRAISSFTYLSTMINSNALSC